MKQEILYIDRSTKQTRREKIYGHFFLEYLYEDGFFSRLLLFCFARIPLFSKLYGLVQQSCFSRLKIKPFIQKFHVDAREFLDPVESFTSFNAFFIRRLKPEARPITKGDNTAIMPADGRYLIFEDISTCDGFLVKGQKFSLNALLHNDALSSHYKNASMAIARLCPTDYHRFHFPCACVPGPARLIRGPLFSVNPIALKKHIHYLSENKRYITSLETTRFGTVLFIEVGATYVGSVHQAYTPGFPCAKGDEKGFFSFGGSCIIMLFEQGKIAFDKDLLEASSQKIETLALFGQSLGLVDKE